MLPSGHPPLRHHTTPIDTGDDFLRGVGSHLLADFAAGHLQEVLNMKNPRQCQGCGATLEEAIAIADGWKRLEVVAHELAPNGADGIDPDCTEVVGAATLCPGCYTETLHWVRHISSPFTTSPRPRQSEVDK